MSNWDVSWVFQVTQSALGYELFDVLRCVVDKITIPMNQSMTFSNAWVANANTRTLAYHYTVSVGKNDLGAHIRHCRSEGKNNTVSVEEKYISPRYQQSIAISYYNYRGRNHIFPCHQQIITGALSSHSRLNVSCWRASAWIWCRLRGRLPSAALMRSQSRIRRSNSLKSFDFSVVSRWCTLCVVIWSALMVSGFSSSNGLEINLNRASPRSNP